MKKTAFLIILVVISTRLAAQGTFSGDLMMNMNFFQRDTNIRAAGNPLYDNALSGSEAWLGLRYNIKGFTFTLRADVFNNSNLKAPASPSTDFGIGAWSINKEMKDLSITVGTIYDQVGSGILFRAYEDRGLLVDNGLVGLELKYKLTNHITLKGFSGQQRNNSQVMTNQSLHTPPYGPVIKGFNAEGDFSSGKVHVIPGIGFINRTLDQTSYLGIVGTVKTQYATVDTQDRFTPVYNMYAGCIYNTLTYKNFSWYLEGDYKSQEAIVALSNMLVNKPGNVAYTSINFGKKGIAIGVTGKRTENFIMRTSPNETGPTDGKLNWQPIIATLRPERLMSRYTAPSEDISEQAYSANLLISPNEVTNLNFTYTHINTLENLDLYREAYGDVYYQGIKNWIVQAGVQYLEYNINAYQGEHYSAPIIYAVTPFTELTYRINEKKSIRGELQYMDTKQNYGSWVFALLEYDIAPRWSISASDMYNVVVNKNSDNPYQSDINKKPNHYYNFYAAYSKGANRFSLAYVKQVDGYNCSGGVCRYEPAFSGVKATITSSF